MSEYTGPAQASPIPAEPSAESVRVLRRRERGGRMDKFAARGMGLALLRQLFRVIALVARPPKNTHRKRESYGDNLSGVWLRADNADDAKGVVLYLHGGGFVLAAVQAGAIAEYSHLTGLPVFMPHYRLAPQHPFPAAADDVLAAYRTLLDNGFAAEKIRIAGDPSTSPHFVEVTTKAYVGDAPLTDQRLDVLATDAHSNRRHGMPRRAEKRTVGGIS